MTDSTDDGQMKASVKRADPSERETFEVGVRERMFALILSHYQSRTTGLADMLLILVDADTAVAWVLTGKLPKEPR